jgi:hypothetical protein
MLNVPQRKAVLAAMRVQQPLAANPPTGIWMSFIKVSAMYKFVPYNLDNWSLYRESIVPPFKRHLDRLYRVEILRDLPHWWDQIDDQRYFYVDIDDIEDE